MHKGKQRILLGICLLVCMMTLTACDAFYQLFSDESTDMGIYTAIYDSENSDEEIASIPNLSLLVADLRNDLKTYDLTFEVSLAYDLETDNEATLSVFYTKNKNNTGASDYCKAGMIFMGTYVMEDDQVVFSVESEGYNIAIYEVGSDFKDNDVLQQLNYNENNENGVWVYACAPYEYEDAPILAEIIEHIPETITFTVAGTRIVNWQ